VVHVSWEAEPLDPAAGALVAARLPLHHAVQVVAAVGQTLAPRVSDDSQQALVVKGPRSWLGAPVAGGRLRAGIDPVDAEIRLCDAGGARLSGLAMEGRTLDEGLAFLVEALRAAGVPDAPLALPSHPADFPHHPLADGAPFPPGGASGRGELARLVDGTHALLARLVGGRDAPLRLWPHHFDLGCSFPLGGLTLGLGVSPGDGTAGAPYWYATVWPRPEGALPALGGGGTWRTSGWSGAELPLARLAREGAAQRAQVEAFFGSAVAAAERIAAAGP
jgi:hypothetical protein